MKVLPRALSSGEHEMACRYADEIARAQIALNEVDVPAPTLAQRRIIEDLGTECAAWLHQFGMAFPQYEWRDFAKPGLLAEIERTRP